MPRHPSRRDRRHRDRPHRDHRSGPPPGPARRNFVVVGHRAVTSPRFTLTDLPGSAGRLDLLCRCVNSALCLSNGLRRDSQLWMVLQGPPGPAVTIRFDGRNARYLNPDERSTGALVRHALTKLEEAERRALKATSQDIAGNGDRIAESQTLEGTEEEGGANEDTKIKAKIETSDQPSSTGAYGDLELEFDRETVTEGAWPEVGELERTPGVYVSRTGLAQTLERLSSAGARMVLLGEGAEPIREVLRQPGRTLSPAPASGASDMADHADDHGAGWAFILGDDRDLTHDELALARERHVAVAGLGDLSLLTSHCIVVVQTLLDELEAEQSPQSQDEAPRGAGNG